MMAALRSRAFANLRHHWCKCDSPVKCTVEFQRTFGSLKLGRNEASRLSSAAGLVNQLSNSTSSLSNNAPIVRFYSKGKEKSKGDKKKKGLVQINDEELEEVINAEAFRRDLDHAIGKLKDDYMKHVSLRTSAGAVENLVVEVDGDKFTLQELAQIGRKGPQTIILNLAGFPQVIPNVLKAIHDSGMGLNPQQDGTTLFISVPKVTKEHRENLAKNAKNLFNKCKDHLRDIHNKYSKDAKRKEKDLSEDLIFSVQQQIQALTEQHVLEAEKLLAAKQQELLGS